MWARVDGGQISQSRDLIRRVRVNHPNILVVLKFCFGEQVKEYSNVKNPYLNFNSMWFSTK